MRLSTSLDRLSLDGIAREFSLSALSACYIAGGSQNTSYLILAPEGRFVATVLERRTPAFAEAYVSLLRRLAACGLPVPSPRPSQSGSWMYHHEGKPVIMTAFIEGACTGPLDETELFKLGALLADLHKSGVRCDADPTIRLSEADLSWLKQARPDPFAHWALAQYRKTGDAVCAGGAHVLTHGDPFRGNVIVSPDGSLALIDWEDAALDLPGIDIGIAVLAHCDRDGVDVSRAGCLLSGYASRSTGDVTLASVVRMASYAGLVLAYRRYRRHVEGATTPDRYRSMQRMVDSLATYRGGQH